MSTRPTNTDSNSASSDTASHAGASPFSGLGAGLSFFQDWMKAAGSALPNLQGAQSGAAGAWNLPTLDPDELEKRIQDLRTVQFWLEQNARLIAMTIQGMEVQRMTLNTLRGMNVSMDAVRDSLKARNTAADDAAGAAPEQAPAGAAVNPMQWWDTLTQQFSNLASQAVQVAQASATSMEQAAGAASPRGDEGPSEAGAKPAARKTGAPVSGVRKGVTPRRGSSTGGSSD